MEFKEIAQALFQYGGTVIMAGLFVWLFFWIITRMQKTLEDLSKTLGMVAQNEANLAKSLDMISNKLTTLDQKSDRNYLEIKKGEN